MALVGEAGFLCDQSKGLIGPAHQRLCTLKPALDDVALRSSADRLLERAAEVIGAQAGDIGENSERKIFIEMRLDVVAHALQPLRRKALGGRQGKMPDKTLGDADTQGGLSTRILSAKPPSVSSSKVVTSWLSKRSCSET